MNIVYIAGGKYKSFYLNYLKKIGKCELLIFNYGIFYDYNIRDETSINIITKELKCLAMLLKCRVLAGVNFVFSRVKQKYLILCENNNYKFETLKNGVNFFVGNVEFVAGGKHSNFLNKNKIVFTKSRIKPNDKRCNKNKIYLFCDDLGLSFVRNKKIKRKFNKCSKIILK